MIHVNVNGVTLHVVRSGSMVTLPVETQELRLHSDMINSPEGTTSETINIKFPTRDWALTSLYLSGPVVVGGDLNINHEPDPPAIAEAKRREALAAEIRRQEANQYPRPVTLDEATAIFTERPILTPEQEVAEVERMKRIVSGEGSWLKQQSDAYLARMLTHRKFGEQERGQ